MSEAEGDDIGRGGGAAEEEAVAEGLTAGDLLAYTNTTAAHFSVFERLQKQRFYCRGNGTIRLRFPPNKRKILYLIKLN